MENLIELQGIDTKLKDLNDLLGDLPSKVEGLNQQEESIKHSLQSNKNRLKEAKAIHAKINPNGFFDELVSEIKADNSNQNNKDSIFLLKYRFSLKLAFLVAFFNQLSGINAFLYYAPRIFEEGGLGESTSLLSSVGIGVINLIFTFIGISLIDKLGRRQLMYTGSFGYIVSLGLVACAFFFQWGGILIPIFLFIFIAAHAIGQGTVIWVFISEIFPNHLRNAGQSFGSSVHWVLAAIIPSFIPVSYTHLTLPTSDLV